MLSRTSTLLLFILVLFFNISFSFITVNPDNHFFVDEVGRVVIFRGVNSVNKGGDFCPRDNYLNTTQIKYLQEFGFNSIRIGSMLAGLMPDNNYSFNETYITECLDPLIEELGNSGIYSILDMHQDVLSKYLCGEGFPYWIIDELKDGGLEFALPVHDIIKINETTKLPAECPGPWASYYLTDQVTRSFQHLYNNLNDSQVHIGNFWEKIATSYVNNTNVLGFEIINEPFPGDVYQNPSLFLPGVGDRENLEPMYKYINSRIRNADNNHMLFYEPITWDITPVGFNDTPSTPELSVLSWHFYCWTMAEGDTPLDWGLCDLEQQDFFYIREKDVNRLGGGQFLTEYGECDGSSQKGIKLCNDILGLIDQYLVSSTYWDYSDGNFYNSNGDLNMDNVKLFSRTYARKIAGVPLSMKFKPSDASFTFSYIFNPTNNDSLLTQPTEIYLNMSVHYPNGVTVNISPDNQYIGYTLHHNIINILISSNTLNNQTITVNINPK